MAAIFSLRFGNVTQAQYIEMAPYDMKTAPEDVHNDLVKLNAPNEITCKLKTCPEKLKAKIMNIFMTDTPDNRIKMRPNNKLPLPKKIKIR